MPRKASASTGQVPGRLKMSERRVESRFVVVDSPGLDRTSGLVEVREPLGIWAFAANRAVERLDEASRLYGVERDAGAMGQMIELIRSRFSLVFVASDKRLPLRLIARSRAVVTNSDSILNAKMIAKRSRL